MNYIDQLVKNGHAQFMATLWPGHEMAPTEAGTEPGDCVKHLTKKQRLATKAALEVIVAALAVAVAVAYTRYIVVVNIKSRPSRGSPSLT